MASTLPPFREPFYMSRFNIGDLFCYFQVNINLPAFAIYLSSPLIILSSSPLSLRSSKAAQQECQLNVVGALPIGVVRRGLSLSSVNLGSNLILCQLSLALMVYSVAGRQKNQLDKHFLFLFCSSHVSPHPLYIPFYIVSSPLFFLRLN